VFNQLSTAVKTWGSGGVAPSSFTSALDVGGWSASRPSRFTPGESVPGTRRIRGWSGSRAGLDAVEWRRISCPCRESNPGYVARCCIDRAGSKLYKRERYQARSYAVCSLTPATVVQEWPFFVFSSSRSQVYHSFRNGPLCILLTGQIHFFP
jgi:hypothetical protein